MFTKLVRLLRLFSPLGVWRGCIKSNFCFPSATGLECRFCPIHIFLFQTSNKHGATNLNSFEIDSVHVLMGVKTSLSTTMDSVEEAKKNCYSFMSNDAFFSISSLSKNAILIAWSLLRMLCTAKKRKRNEAIELFEGDYAE